jgi:RHS repeat-associated protein
MGNIGETLTTMSLGNLGSQRQDALHEIVSVSTFDLGGNQTSGGPMKTKKFLYDGWNCIAEYTGTTLKKTNLWGLDLSGILQGAGGVGGLLLITDHSALLTSHYPCYDGNGNIRKLLNATTLATTATYDYAPFGKLIRATGPYAAANSYRHSTKPQDKDTGLVYYNYRHYDTKTGRWLNRDPIEERGGFNLYNFLGNRPSNAYDILGNAPGDTLKVEPCEVFVYYGHLSRKIHLSGNSMDGVV